MVNISEEIQRKLIKLYKPHCDWIMNTQTQLQKLYFGYLVVKFIIKFSLEM